jgi:hypothetical protein
MFEKGDIPGRYESLAKYVAKYVMSPPIAVRRIDAYDGQKVTYHYRSNMTKESGEGNRRGLYVYRENDSACFFERV